MKQSAVYVRVTRGAGKMLHPGQKVWASPCDQRQRWIFGMVFGLVGRVFVLSC